jgi:hypothetical protein
MGRVKNSKRLRLLLTGGLLALFLALSACDNTLLWDRVQNLAFMGWWDEGDWYEARFGD